MSSPDTKIVEVLDFFENAWVKKIPEVVFTHFKNGVAAKEQECKHASYCAQRSPQDGKINWSQNAITIMQFINAQSFPYPGAFTLIDQQKIIIESISVFESVLHQPGQVTRVDDQILVGCGSFSAIVIEKIPGAGNRRTFKPGIGCNSMDYSIKKSEDKKLVSFTLDIDWAPDFVLEYCLQLFAQLDIKSLFFIHDTGMQGITRGTPAWHSPKFSAKRYSGDNITEIMDYCLSLVPDSKIMRTHSLISSPF